MVEPPEEREEGWQWIGDPGRPEAKKFDDGISDLVEGPDLEQEEEDMDDLMGVDFEVDILDVGDDGTLEDLVNVTNEDIIGMAPRPQYRRPAPRRRTTRRNGPPPDTSLGGMRG